MQYQLKNISRIAISVRRKKLPLDRTSSRSWLSAVFSAMDSLRAVGGGIATITAVAGQYQLDVQPSAGKE